MLDRVVLAFTFTNILNFFQSQKLPQRILNLKNLLAFQLLKSSESANHIDPLLKYALAAVPADRQAETPVYLFLLLLDYGSLKNRKEGLFYKKLVHTQ